MTTDVFTRRAAAVAALALLLDQVTKTLVRLTLTRCVEPPSDVCERVPMGGPAALVRLENGGSALGFAQGLVIWTVLAAAALVVVLILPRWSGASRMMAAGSGLLLGGAAGNLLDRLLFGHVTDFLELSWSTDGGIAINVADLALLAGAVLATVVLSSAVGAGTHPGTADAIPALKLSRSAGEPSPGP
jgi:signal peptidase II